MAPQPPDLSIIIVNWNTRQLLLDCLASVLDATRHLAGEIIVVDNGSHDGSPEAVRRQFGPQVQVLANPDNRGFARANNQALQISRARRVMLLNSDTLVARPAIDGLIAFLDAHPQAAMVGPRMVDQHKREQNCFDNIPCLLTELGNKSLLRLLWPQRFAGKSAGRTDPLQVESLIGACLLLRRDAIDQVGLLDEDYFFFLEETDWCLRLQQAGWQIWHDPRHTIVHLQGQSKKLRPAAAWIEYYRSLYLFFSKHRSAPVYLVLRVCRFGKLAADLLLNLLGMCVTLGQHRRYRQKTAIYGRIVLWHVLGCPRSAGLRGGG